VGSPFFVMNIVTAVPKYSDGEVDAAFMREIRTGFQLERAMEKYRVEGAESIAKERKEMDKKSPLGKCVGVMPQRDYFRLIRKYGHEEVHSDEFMSYFNKKFPNLSPSRV